MSIHLYFKVFEFTQKVVSYEKSQKDREINVPSIQRRYSQMTDAMVLSITMKFFQVFVKGMSKKAVQVLLSVSDLSSKAGRRDLALMCLLYTALPPEWMKSCL